MTEALLVIACVGIAVDMFLTLALTQALMRMGARLEALEETNR